MKIRIAMLAACVGTLLSTNIVYAAQGEPLPGKDIGIEEGCPPDCGKKVSPRTDQRKKANSGTNKGGPAKPHQSSGKYWGQLDDSDTRKNAISGNKRNARQHGGDHLSESLSLNYQKRAATKADRKKQ